jgi:6-phosphofructokinase 2
LVVQSEKQTTQTYASRQLAEQQAASSKQQAASSKQQAASSKQQAANVVSG